MVFISNLQHKLDKEFKSIFCSFELLTDICLQNYSAASCLGLFGRDPYHLPSFDFSAFSKGLQSPENHATFHCIFWLVLALFGYFLKSYIPLQLRELRDSKILTKAIQASCLPGGKPRRIRLKLHFFLMVLKAIYAALAKTAKWRLKLLNFVL